MGKSSPKPPATPDYTGAAVAQGAANLEAAKQSAYMSNPNIYTPLGSQQVTWNKQSTVDQTAYNKAMEQFRADAAAGRPLGAPPDVKDFTVTIEQPTIRQELTPEAQATLEAQQRVERQLAGLGEQAICKVGGMFVTPFTPNLAPMQTGIGYTPVGQGPDITGMGQAVSAPGAEALEAAPNLAGMGQAQGGPQAAQLSQANLAGVGGVQGGPQTGMFGLAGGNVGAERLQQTLDTSRLAQMPVGAGMTAQQAILSRAMPALQSQRAALETQLANQGLVRGGEAYNAAMMQQAQKENDIITQAALQGISVDAAMRQQGFGELQAQADLANQARQAQFGMGLSGQQLANQAVGQNFQQALAAQAAQNQAQQQQFEQALGAQGFNQQAILAQFGMGQQAAQAANAALAQNQQAALQQQAAQAARQAQMFGQGMDVAGFYNQALAQRQAAAQQQYQMQLAAQNQAFNQAQAAAAFANQARQQGLSEQMALRAQPLNEITALLGGSQIQMPQFQGYQGTQVAAAPMFAATQAAGNFAQQNYGNQVAAYNARMGLLGDLAGAGATAYGLRR